MENERTETWPATKVIERKMAILALVTKNVSPFWLFLFLATGRYGTVRSENDDDDDDDASLFAFHRHCPPGRGGSPIE